MNWTSKDIDELIIIIDEDSSDFLSRDEASIIVEALQYYRNIIEMMEDAKI